MCGRYHIDGNVRKELEILFPDKEWIHDFLEEPECDIKPSDSAVVMAEGADGLEFRRQYWGFPGIQNRGLVINARAESVLDKRMFQDSVLRRRVVIPASRFYEWSPAKEKAAFFREDSQVMFMAGFYQRFEDGERFVILTTQANDSVSSVHDRMPLILERDELEDWILCGERTKEFLQRTPVMLDRDMDYEQMCFSFL